MESQIEPETGSSPFGEGDDGSTTLAGIMTISPIALPHSKNSKNQDLLLVRQSPPVAKNT